MEETRWSWKKIFQFFVVENLSLSVTSSTPEEAENTESGRKEMFDWEMNTLGRERFL